MTARPWSARSLIPVRSAAAVVLPFLISLCLVELVLRNLDPIGVGYFSEAGRYFASMQPNELYAYIHTPGFRGRFQEVDVSINSHGFRGPEVDFAKAPRKTRILILGDSVVFGWGAPQSSIFPIELQRIFESEALDVEVIPAGVGSWNTRTEYEYLRSTGISFRPEVIVLVITANDVEPKNTGRTDVPKELLNRSGTDGAGSRVVLEIWRAGVSRSYLLAYIQYFAKLWGVRRQQKQVTAKAPTWEDARLALEGIGDLSRRSGATLLVYLYGSPHKIEADAVLRLYKEHLKASGLQFYALPEELFSDPRLRNSVVDGHPNAGGHRVIAREMSKNLGPIVREIQAERLAQQP